MSTAPRRPRARSRAQQDHGATTGSSAPRFGGPRLVAEQYRAAGLSVIPIQTDKRPAVAWKPYQERVATPGELDQWFARGSGRMAVVCGAVSGHREVLDFDDPDAYIEWCGLIPASLLDRLPTVQTPSGGYHVHYSCEPIEGNQKLAMRDATTVAIETRGEAGYVLVPPSSGYIPRRGNISDAPRLTSEERTVLFDAARALNRWVEPSHFVTDSAISPTPNGEDRPGDEYNVRGDIAALIRTHGWVQVHTSAETSYWRHPNKTSDGWSATLGKCGPNVFYNFSTNAYPFAAERAYSPFAVYTLLEHAGDFRAAAKALATEGYGSAHSPAVTPVGAPASSRSASQRAETMPEQSDEPETAVLRGDSRMRTDYGNAERLVDQHGPDIHWVFERGMWATYHRTNWQLDETGEVERRAKRVVRNIYREAAARPAEEADERAALGKHAASSEAASRLRAMIDLARSEGGITVHLTDFDRDPWLLNCQNGTVDLRAGNLRAHDRAELHMRITPVAYDPHATCPIWEAFLHRIMGGNEQVITFLQRAIGYSLTGVTREQVFFLLHGVGANGKSTFLETLAALLAGYAQQAQITTFLRKQHDEGIPNDLARMVGARFISAVEADEGVRLSESLIKQLTGGDRITVRFLHQEFFDFIPEAKYWFAMNHRPTIRGTDHAMWRRPLLIPFGVVIPDEEQDKGLKAKLQAELPGILAWAVQGCLDWQTHGLAIPEEVRAATSEYRAEMDTLAGFFEERCTLTKDAWVPSSDLYRAYREWSEEAGERYETEQMFGKKLTERGLTREKRSGKRCWFGITLVNTAVQQGLDTMDTMDTVSEVSIRENLMTKNPGESVHSVHSVQPPPRLPVSVPETATPPSLTENATVYQKTIRDRLTNDFRGILARGEDLPASASLAKDFEILGFEAKEGESTYMLGLDWFGLRKSEGGEGDAT